jgi:hypothetical protein
MWAIPFPEFLPPLRPRTKRPPRSNSVRKATKAVITEDKWTKTPEAREIGAKKKPVRSCKSGQIGVK